MSKYEKHTKQMTFIKSFGHHPQKVDPKLIEKQSKMLVEKLAENEKELLTPKEGNEQIGPIVPLKIVRQSSENVMAKYQWSLLNRKLQAIRKSSKNIDEKQLKKLKAKLSFGVQS